MIAVLVLLLAGNYVRKEEVQGRVMTRDVVRIASERAAHVDEMLVGSGESVKRGQPLIRLRTVAPENFEADGDQALSVSNIERLHKLLDELVAEENLARSAHAAQQDLLQRQLRQLDQDLALNSRIGQSIQRRVGVALDERQRHAQLAGQGAVSGSALDQAVVAHESALEDQASNELARASTQQRSLELQQRVSQAEQDLAARLGQFARQRNEWLERLELLEQNQGHVLLSPVAGVVDTVAVFAGDRVEVGQPMMLLRVVQPRHPPLRVMLDVNSSAIGFATPGTEVILRFDAFPYERYGVVKGAIVHRSASTYKAAVPDAAHDDSREVPTYLVEVKPDFSATHTRIREDWLKDGMTLRGSLSLERTSLMEWLFLPLRKGLERNPGFWRSERAGAPITDEST
ncbi:HlyD family secretion protein [Pseudomonas agarici]|uniref:HlyD family secretion protein n=1 Tax=Pseudomonas agarici TaxID=46677 RepID=UPI0003179F83|nr:HlyD family efflux transporter periplasmic adaptor subunit [Pseudomonas agarici]